MGDGPAPDLAAPGPPARGIGYARTALARHTGIYEGIACSMGGGPGPALSAPRQADLHQIDTHTLLKR